MRHHLLTLVLPLIATCARADEKVAFPEGSTCHFDLVYSKPNAKTTLQLDIAQPRGKGPFPVLVYIHGGGWLIGGRKTYLPYMASTVAAGYVAVSIDYRLGQPFPAAIHDAKCAVRWLRAHAPDHAIDPQRIGVVGYSAGGQLACLLGTTAGNAAMEGEGGCSNASSRVHAVAAYYALTDLAELHRACEKKELSYFDRTRMLTSLLTYCKGPPARAKTIYTLASPVTHVHRDAAAMLIIHGDRDTQVPVRQSRIYHDRLKKTGADAELLVVKGAEHNFVGAYEKTATVAMMRFFDSRLKKR